MSITLKQLEALHWVDKLGSFQLAATRLHTTQSAISKRIRELESIYGGELFDRTHRKAVLTAKGKRIAAAAEEMLELHRRIVSDLVAPSYGVTTVRLGVTELIAMTWLESFFRQVREAFDTVYFELVVDHGGNLLGRLSKGNIDIALTPGPMWGNAFESIELAPLARSWMASPSLGIQKKTLTFEELSEYPFVMLDVETVHSQLQNSWFQRNGFFPHEKIIANSTMVVGNLVKSGLGVGLLPSGYYTNSFDDNQFVTLNTDPSPPTIDYFAVFRREHRCDLFHELGELAHQSCRGDKGWMPD